jgi:integrase
VTVGDAAKLYLSQMGKRSSAGQITASHFTSQSFRLQRAIEPLEKLPLCVVGERHLTDAVLKLAERPMMTIHRPAKTTITKVLRTKRKHKRPVGRRTFTKRRMSPIYARAAIASMRWFFAWCDESDQVNWKRPAMFRGIFQSRPVMDGDEQRKALVGDVEIDHFTLEELGQLWAAAGNSDLNRAVILLGMNCAFGPAECSDLKIAECLDFDDPSKARIERFRSKTIRTAGRGSFAKWKMWTETVQILKAVKAKGDGHMLGTADGHRLCEHNSIGQSWRRLCRRARVRYLPPKYLRKTAAHMIRVTLGHGSEVAEMMLSHTDRGMLRHYSGRDWSKLETATTDLRRHLSPMFGDNGK